MRNNDSPLFGGVLVVLVLIIAAIAMPFACTVSADDSNAKTTFSAYGITDVKTNGYPWFSCGEDYSFGSKFDATSAKGEPISGVICCGWWKGCTLKF